MTSPQQTDRDHVEGVPLPAITDETMRSRLAMAQRYTAVLLRRTEKLVRPGVDPAIWEHGRRNIALVENGVMAIVLPVADDSSDWAGLAVFTADEATVRAILDHDPGVQAGIFDYEIHPVRGFPGAHLPSPEPEGTAPEARW